MYCVAAMQLIRRSKSPYVAILPWPSLIAVFAGRRRITSETRCTTVSGQVDLIVGPLQLLDHKCEGAGRGQALLASRSMA